MKKIAIFTCFLTIPSLQAMYLKNMAKNCIYGAVLGNGIGLLEKNYSAKKADVPQYTVNLMWINMNLQNDQKYVFPSQWRRESDFDQKNFDTVFKWESLNPNAPIHVWFDSNYVPAQAIANTETLIQNHAEKKNEHTNTYEYSFKTDTNISLKDIRELSHVKEHPAVFSDKIPVYFRADLLRVIASVNTLSISKEPYFVYTDLDVTPLSQAELFDEETKKNLNENGMVVANGNFYGENSFHIMSNHKPNLLKAINRVLIDLNIVRAHNLINGTLQGHPANIPELVFSSYPWMFYYFCHLENRLSLIKGDKQVYEEQDGLEPFNPNHTAGCIFNFNGNTGNCRMPQKRVSRPMNAGGYLSQDERKTIEKFYQEA